MELKHALKYVKKADKQSEDFFNLVVAVGEKYFDFDDPDEYQMSGALLWSLILKGEPWLVEMTARLANELLNMVEEGRPSVGGSFGLGGKEYWFQFSDDPKGFGKLEKLMRQNLIMKAKEQSESNCGKEKGE